MKYKNFEGNELEFLKLSDVPGKEKVKTILSLISDYDKKELGFKFASRVFRLCNNQDVKEFIDLQGDDKDLSLKVKEYIYSLCKEGNDSPEYFAASAAYFASWSAFDAANAAVCAVRAEAKYEGTDHVIAADIERREQVRILEAYYAML